MSDHRPQTIAYPAPGARPYGPGSETIAPHAGVLFGATADLVRRKLPPGLTHLAVSALAPSIRASYYGKRPGPGMKLDKLSMQFSSQEGEHSGDTLEAYERLILDAMRGEYTLFTTADGIESRWERSLPMLDDPPPVKPYGEGSWAPTRSTS